MRSRHAASRFLSGLKAVQAKIGAVEGQLAEPEAAGKLRMKKFA
jgi:hypothetical protein